MPSHITSAPLVGAHFHPPAKALLAVLRTNTALRLQREPENPYDANAIGVWLDISALDYDVPIEPETLAGYGFTVADLDHERSWQLGHIAAKTGEAAALAPLLDAGELPSATLGFDMKGAPVVRLEWGPAQWAS